MTNNSFDHIKWIKDFRIASEKVSGFRELRAEIFKQTVEIVQKGYYFVDGEKISISNDNVAEETIFYHKPEKLNGKNNNIKTRFSVIEADTIETGELLKKAGYNVCVLNMANRQNPGGGVLGGAGAQEENIFRRTNIFMSMYQFREYADQYGIKRSDESYPLNRNTGGVYSKDITVFRGSESNGYCLLKNPFKLSFVSVPAINRPDLVPDGNKYKLNPRFVEPTKEKIRTILRISGKAGHDALVLSALGCGAFRNPPEHVARLFKEVFMEPEFKNRFKIVVFAILENHNSWGHHNPEGNVLPFVKEFDD